MLEPVIFFHLFLHDGEDRRGLMEDLVGAIGMGLQAGFIALFALIVAHRIYI